MVSCGVVYIAPVVSGVFGWDTPAVLRDVYRTPTVARDEEAYGTTGCYGACVVDRRGVDPAAFKAT